MTARRQSAWNRAVRTIVVLGAIEALAFFIRLVIIPTTDGDAGQYLRIGVQLRFEGMAALGELRTYGYPAFVAVISGMLGVSGLEQADLARTALAVALAQWLLYVAAVLWVARSIAATAPRLATAVLAGLLLHPFLVSLVLEPLTDGFSLILAVALLGALLSVIEGSPRGRIGWFALGAGLAAFAIEVRPANLVLALAWGTAAVFALLASDRRDATRVTAPALGVGGLAALMALLPQALYNAHAFGVVSVLAHVNLAQFQMNMGKFVLKYGTLLGADHTGLPLYYCNGFFDPAHDGVLIGYYLHNPLAGVATMLGHLFGAFDWDYPFVYVRNLAFPSPALSVASWAVIGLGLSGAVRIAPASRRALRSRYAPSVVYVGAAFVLVCAQTALAAPESRFIVVPLAVLATLAALRVIELVKATARERLITAGVALVVALLGVSGSIGLHRVLSLRACASIPGAAPVVHHDIPSAAPWSLRSSPFIGQVTKQDDGTYLFSGHPAREGQQPRTIVASVTALPIVRIRGTVAFYDERCWGATIVAGSDGGADVRAGTFTPKKRGELDVVVPNIARRAVYLDVRGRDPTRIEFCTLRIEGLRVAR